MPFMGLNLTDEGGFCRIGRNFNVIFYGTISVFKRNFH